MTKPYRPAALLALAFVAAPLGAQQGPLDAQCQAPAYVPGTIPSQQQVRADACQKAIDLFNFMAPQLGVSITGGNPVLGSGGTLGGLGHFSIGLRANVAAGQLPQTDGVTLSATGPQRSNFAPKDQYVGLPSAEAAVGLFKGIPLGLTNALGLDALVSAFYVPDIDQDAVSVRTTGSSLKLGYGARLGILQETAIVPGVSVSVMRRDLPTVNLVATVGTGDSVRVTGLQANTTAWRAVVSKRVMLLGFAAGGGQDRYDARARAGAYVASRNVATPIGNQPTPAFSGEVASASQKMTRTNVFADVSLVLPVVRITGEIGRVSGGSVRAAYNSFGDRAADGPYTYGSIGLRLGF